MEHQESMAASEHADKYERIENENKQLTQDLKNLETQLLQTLEQLSLSESRHEQTVSLDEKVYHN